VNRHTQQAAERCDCCGYMSRQWVHVEYRENGRTGLDVKLCFRCATSVEDALFAVLRVRVSDPAPRRTHERA